MNFSINDGRRHSYMIKMKNKLHEAYEHAGFTCDGSEYVNVLYISPDNVNWYEIRLNVLKEGWVPPFKKRKEHREEN